MIFWTDFTPDSEAFSAQRPALLNSVNNLSVAVDSAVCLNHFDHGSNRLDLSAAFDAVHHSVLLERFEYEVGI